VAKQVKKITIGEYYLLLFLAGFVVGGGAVGAAVYYLHPSKAALDKIVAEIKAIEKKGAGDVKAVIARLRKLL